MRNLTLTPQALPFFGAVEIAKEEAEPKLIEHYDAVKHTFPKSPKKGFRPSGPSRADAEKAVGMADFYHTIWRDIFIETINAYNPTDPVCYVDELAVTDRGPFWEVSGVTFLTPRFTFNVDTLKLLEQHGEVWLRDTVVCDKNLQLLIDRIRKQHATKKLDDDSPIAEGDFIDIVADSDLNKGFKGKPHNVTWEVREGKLPQNIIECLLGRQTGQTVVIPTPPEVGKVDRTVVKIVKHYHVENASLDELAQKEGLVNGEALLLRERQALIANFEKSKPGYFFNLMKLNSQNAPIPGAFIFDMAQNRMEALKKEMGPRSFQQKFGPGDVNQFLPQASEEAYRLFLSFRLCEKLGISFSEEEIEHAMQCERIPDSQENKIHMVLSLYHEKVLHRFCGVEPPVRSTLILPSKGDVPRIIH